MMASVEVIDGESPRSGAAVCTTVAAQDPLEAAVGSNPRTRSMKVCRRPLPAQRACLWIVPDNAGLIWLQLVMVQR